MTTNEDIDARVGPLEAGTAPTGSTASSHEPPPSPAKFTKGPWEVLTLNGRLPIVREIKMPHGEASTYRAVVRSSAGEGVCTLDFGYGRPVDEANAILIAAVTDLFDALKECVDTHDLLTSWAGKSDPPEIHRARVALIKAVGR